MSEQRSCKNCACYAEVSISPLAPPQPQCMRNGPQPAQIRVERPRLDKEGNAVIGKDRKPVTEASVENVFLFAPTHPDKVCFDGWRPVGTLPGENHVSKALTAPLLDIVRAIAKGKMNDARMAVESMIDDALKDAPTGGSA